MSTEDDKKNTKKDKNKPKRSLLLQFKNTASKRTKAPDPLLIAEQLTNRLDEREVKTLIEVIGDIQRDPTKQPGGKQKRSKIINPGEKQSPSEKFLTLFRSNPSTRHVASPLLEEGAKATTEKPTKPRA